MKPATSDDIFELMDSYVASAAVGTAMECGLFWLLAEEPRDVAFISESLNIPENRCRFWLQILHELGLLDRVSEGYAVSTTARTTILDAYSKDTWAFLARETRERFPAVRDLAVQIQQPGSPWDVQGLTPPDWLAALREQPDRAHQFTRMLYEVHLPLAEAVAESLPLDGVGRMMDVGGGSGVMSFAFLRRVPTLKAVVVEIENVCDAGREIARENALQDRIDYQVCDFLADDLPTGFDLILYCDVGCYQEALFHKMFSALSPGGRLVIVDKFGPERGLAHPSRIHWALVGAMSGTHPIRPTTEDVQGLLKQVGFSQSTVTQLPDLGSRWSSGWIQIVASY